MDAVTDLEPEHSSQRSESPECLGDATVHNVKIAIIRKIVNPKGIKDIAWRQRHGPILRALIFNNWSQVIHDSLATTLLQLSPEDLPFQEMAYTALCLAAGGEYINVVSSQAVTVRGAFEFIGSGPEDTADSVSICLLTSEADLQGFPPKSSPEGTIYWFNNVLVLLAARLYLPGAVEGGIIRLVDYCQKNHSAAYVDAVLISVEHVVVVHITPARKVQHTAVMPLYNIKNHVSMGVNDRDANSHLERFGTRDEPIKIQGTKRKRKANQADVAEEYIFARHAIQVDREITSTFYALTHLFEAAACKRMPFARSTGGRFPDEIYTNIIELVTDIETRYSLMNISRHFRRVCQEDLLFAKDLVFEPSDTCRRCDDEASFIPEWFERYDVRTGVKSRFEWRRDRYLSCREEGLWWVAVGEGRNKRSLLAGVGFRCVDV